MSWIAIGSLILNAVLALLFIMGGFFMTKRYLRKMREARNQQES
ncbi:hypothetical protein [Alicyclobacillus cycloheptanicus]|uniref:Uncharacterized protein YneF (UPF0154 family) n=1 Tax=Alicyclobacillus cycloheptanicus TaxID=1457 RepID=A0ABT9XLV3_9BACL|nr:hypothetical protein [Alicyclobacillus cycloheptanicus]MDQ0191288.1 uncharacterized protein YneF (UPF0154 family) [Alicyclobacillus cycloheptanicus]